MRAAPAEPATQDDFTSVASGPCVGRMRRPWKKLLPLALSAAALSFCVAEAARAGTDSSTLCQESGEFEQTCHTGPASHEAPAFVPSEQIPLIRDLTLAGSLPLEGARSFLHQSLWATPPGRSPPTVLP